MSKVDFISCPPFSFKKEKIIRVLKKYAEDEGYSIKKIQYNFLEKPAMLKMNKSYLGHDSHTDIITFDYSENMSINAEVYISIDMMKENAKKFKQSTENEMVRLISHALFHCMGHSDKSKLEKEKMRIMEEKFINDVSRETITNV